MIQRLLLPYAIPLAVALAAAGYVFYLNIQASRVEGLETQVENLEQTIDIKEEAIEVRTRPVPAAVSDILDRM